MLLNNQEVTQGIKGEIKNKQMTLKTQQLKTCWMQ